MSMQRILTVITPARVLFRNTMFQMRLCSWHLMASSCAIAERVMLVDGLMVWIFWRLKPQNSRFFDDRGLDRRGLWAVAKRYLFDVLNKHVFLNIILIPTNDLVSHQRSIWEAAICKMECRGSLCRLLLDKRLPTTPLSKQSKHILPS